MTEQEDRWLRAALDRATANVADGGGPFAALVVRGDEVVAEGVNRVTRDLDPTAHAEVVAIRAACRALGDSRPDRHASWSARASRARCAWPPRCGPGSTASSTPPTGTTRPTAGFDDRAFYELFDRPRDTWDLPVRQDADGRRGRTVRRVAGQGRPGRLLTVRRRGSCRPAPGWATGVGSLPGTDPREAAAVVAGELPDLPHLPELPGRGPGADMVGRTAARCCVDLHVDLQPSGWRLVDRPGMDERRARVVPRAGPRRARGSAPRASPGR